MREEQGSAILRPMRFPALAAFGLLAAALLSGCGERAPAFDVTVAFNEQYTEGDIQETDAILRSYDDDIDVLIQESFPPVARTVIRSSLENFCEDLRSKLEVKPYVERVDCEEQL
ncbi:MAG TPA: hypothetical protein VNN12_02350 [Dehalococcoidia bacterium]|nr:hypothetical protein [Dehalococcoidia bacterium]